MLKQNEYAFELTILGEGAERANLEMLIRQSHLEQYVVLQGFQPNPYPYIRVADLVVCSSRYEGLSTVITEALILGKPVVTTPCSGMDELLGDSEFGLITKDSVEGIYQGMKRMLDEPKLREAYAKAASERGKIFSKEVTVKQTEQFFRDLLKK